MSRFYKNLVRELMGMGEHEPAPKGVFKFTCHRYLNQYPGIPIQVELKDSFQELEISVEEYCAESILFDGKIELDTSIDFSFTRLSTTSWYGTIAYDFHVLTSQY